jgi:peptidoglycan/xylan/chitin deacetylase (PgdA/CDA1 family)
MSALLAVLLAFPAVVMYHRVDAAVPGDSTSQRLTVSPLQFAAELRSIHRLGLHTIGISELARDVETGQSPARAVLLTFDDGYSDQFQYAFPILEHFGDRATFFVNVATIGTPNHMTWEDVDAMSRAGMSIECHGMSHADLAALSTTAQTYQIGRCVAALSAHLQNAVLAYAYPSGAFNAQTLPLERRAGLLFGFTTDPRFQTDPQSPYELTRIRVLNGMSDTFFTHLLERSRAYVDFAPDTGPKDASP